MSTTSTDADLRCPQCAAHVRAGSEWCTLCYADLRPAPAPAVVDETISAGTDADGAGLVANADPAAGSTTPARDALPQTYAAGHYAGDTQDTAVDAAAPARRGKHAKRAAGPSVEETDALAAQLLAQLAAEESSAPLGRLTGLTDSPGKKVGLILGGSVTLILVFFTLMTIIGLVV